MIVKITSVVFALICLCYPIASCSQTAGDSVTPSSVKSQKQVPNARKKKPVAKTTTAYMETANDALDSMDRMFLVISESKSIFLPAKLEVEKLLAKAQRVAKNSADDTAQEALTAHMGLAGLCRTVGQFGGSLNGECNAGKLMPSRIKAYALINNREFKE